MWVVLMVRIMQARRVVPVVVGMWVVRVITILGIGRLPVGAHCAGSVGCTGSEEYTTRAGGAGGSSRCGCADITAPMHSSGSVGCAGGRDKGASAWHGLPSA